jgi:hypothetical protein
MYRPRGSGWAALLVSAAACTAVDNVQATDPASSLSEPVFRCKVEPILIRQCSYNACHGLAGTALRVYSPGKLRKDQAGNIDALIAQLTDAEHHDNFESAAGFAFGTTSVEDNFLLRKPLASSDGGYEHAGGAIFTSGSDPQLVAILSWLSGQGGCP